jgi:hypothetical protein
VANILGDIIVRLLANTASFEQGMNAATRQAKASAKEIQGSFNEMGEAASKLLEPLGAIGQTIGAAFSGVGAAASSILTTLGPLGGAFGAVGLGIAGVGAVGLAAGTVVLGLAAHASEAAAKLEELSKSTGVSVQELSLLGDVASTKGISIDSMAKAMEKLDKAAVAAAASGPKSSNAFTELGVSVKNADGSMRSASEIFNDVSVKFAAMPDGPLKTAEAIKLFGRAGAEMIPLLDEGGAKMAELEGHFTKLNAVVDGPTAQSSAELKENMTLMGAAFQGVENELVSDLVPALNVAAKEFIAFFEENQGSIKSFVDGIANVAKVTLNLFQIIGEALSLLYKAVVLAVEEIQLVGSTAANVAVKIKNLDWTGAWHAASDGAHTAASVAKNDFGDAVNSIKSSISGIADVWKAALPPEEKAKTGGSPAPSGKPADVGFVNAQVIKDQAQANKELAAAMRDSTAAGIEAAAQQDAQGQIEELEAKAKDKQVAGTKAFKDALAAAIPKIQEATLWQETFKAAAADQKQFESFTTKITEQATALENEGQVQGKVAQEQQKALATLDPLKAKLGEMLKVYADLNVTTQDGQQKQAQLGAIIAKLQAELDAATAGVNRYNTALANKAVTDSLTKIGQQITTLKTENDALVSGNPFGKLDAELQRLINDLPPGTAGIDKMRDAVARLKAETIKGDVLKSAQVSGFDPAQLAKLNDEIIYLQNNWQQLGLSDEQYHQTMLKLQKDYEDLKAKAGAASDGMKAGFADFAASVPTMSQTMETVVNKGLDGIAQNFTDMVVKGKADWQGLFDSMESTILNAAIKGLMKNLLGSLFGSNDSSGGGGGLLASLFSGFGGGKEVGGDVTPGKAYIVGEKRPELFIPGRSGTIVPQIATAAGNTIHQTVNIQAQDADSFMRSKSQVAAELHRQAGAAFSRSRA